MNLLYRPALLTVAAACYGAALAQTTAPSPTTPPAPPPPSIAYATVADALKALQARDGNGTIVVHADGWTIVNEPQATAQWSFTPRDHYAYPAVVRRVVLRNGKEVSVDTATLCEAPAEACERLRAEFAALNGRISQAVKARGRQGSTPPPQ